MIHYSLATTLAHHLALESLRWAFDRLLDLGYRHQSWRFKARVTGTLKLFIERADLRSFYRDVSYQNKYRR